MTHNLAGLNQLFMWSVANMDDSPNLVATDPARPLQKFDPELMEAIFGQSDTQKMKLLVNVLKQDTSTSQQRVEALQALEDFVEQVDNANDLDKLGGIEAILRVSLGSDDSAERAAGAAVLAAVARNNAPGQVAVFSRGGLAAVLDRLRKETEPAVLARLVGAISAVVQRQPNALALAHRSGALAQMGRLMTLRDAAMARVQDRIVFLCCALMHDSTALNALDDSGLVGFIIMTAASVSQLLDGLQGYHAVDAARLHRVYGDALRGLAARVAADADPHTAAQYAELLRIPAPAVAEAPLMLGV